MRGTLDRTVWELAAERGPRERGQLHRVALAVVAAGAAAEVDDAMIVLLDATDELGGANAAGPTVREVLERAGVDVAAVREQLRLVDQAHAVDMAAVDVELERKVVI
jgi:hypothetical protein